MKEPTSFAIPGAVAIAPGNGGLPKVTLTHRAGAGAEVYLHGAHVTSWKSAKGEELLFLSRESHWTADKPIRGGIPVCWPQFGGQGPLPQHGFARTNPWTLARAKKLDNGDVAVALRLNETDATLKLWPHRFAFELCVTLAESSLTLATSVRNAGEQPFDFQIALHTYFAVADIHRAAVCGLRGTAFVDSLRNNAREVEQRSEIRFDQETDRVYINAPDDLSIRDEATGRVFGIRKTGMADAVVWNPWVAKSQRMSDFGDDEYLRMLCVETGNMATHVALAPNQQWQGATVLSVGRA
ncbi:MAG: D-hexose-6-phosphate mutarotase [Verrucomicrobia bacterium]|nr:D-hexose-6-phosphate mutarotase [Verrucomicrobiota bacterium]